MVIYDERLAVPVRWWLCAVLAALGAGAALLPLGEAGAAAGAGLFAAVLGWALRSYGAARIRIADGVLAAEGIILRAEHFGRVEILDEDEAFAWRTRRAGPRARFLIRGYLPAAVRVEIADPALLVPYVYLSTRRPAELARALGSARSLYGAGRAVA